MNDNETCTCLKADWEGYACINRGYAEMIDFHEQHIKKPGEKRKKSMYKMSEYRKTLTSCSVETIFSPKPGTLKSHRKN